jgi:2-methylcitrate dehydratase PrpD
MRERRENRMPSADGHALTRRTVLGGIGMGLAATLLQNRISFAAEPLTPVMVKLSAYMSDARTRVLPAEVVEKAKRHILDTFTAMLSGTTLPPARAAFAFAQDYNTDTTATIVGTQMTAGPLEAALVNGMLAHSDETDDSHEFSQSHPGCATVPAALAAGEKFGIDGTHFVRAVALGYDVGPRVTMSFDALDFRNNSHKSTHAIAGHFGAAAAAGCAASLNAQQMRWLLDYTAQQSSGIGAWSRDTEHIEKAFVFAGMTARSGTTAALLIHAGFNGIEDIFSGADNFFAAYAPNARPELLIEKLGERYEITRTNIKKWTVGSPIQAPLDAMYNILQRRPLKADEVKEVVVRVSHTEARIVDNREMPDISLQHMVTVMLMDGTASFEAAHDKARMSDPTLLTHKAKVKLIPSDDLEKLEPQRVAIVEITLNDGTVLRERVDDVRGTASNPMTRDEVVQKARDLVDPVLGKTGSSTFIDTILNIETVKNVRDLRSVLQKA